MYKKMNLLLISGVLTVIVFLITTAIQKVFVRYEPTVEATIALQDIQVNRALDAYMFKKTKVPLSLIFDVKTVKSPENVINHYSIEPIHKGEILRYEAIASKGDVKIIEVEPGREKISVKLKGPENAISYQVKTGDSVSLYYTGRYDTVKNLVLRKEFLIPASQIPEEDNFCTLMLLEKAVVLGVFDSSGISLGDYARREKVDTVVFSVTHEDAMIINNCKGQGTFDLTGLPYQKGEQR